MALEVEYKKFMKKFLADDDFIPKEVCVPEMCRFEMPPNGQTPKQFLQENLSGANGVGPMNFNKGTTCLGFIYEPKSAADKGGIVVAVDSRATGGSFIASATVDKVVRITDYIAGTIAGCAADCQFWLRMLSKQCQLYELQNKEQMTVAACSKLLANMVYNYKGMNLSLGCIIAGYDKRGPQLYMVQSDGLRHQGKMFSCGSGSLAAYGVIDTDYKPEMSDAEAYELGRKAIMHATFRDIGSGGSAKVVHIAKDGQTTISTTDVTELSEQKIKLQAFQPSLD